MTASENCVLTGQYWREVGGCGVSFPERRYGSSVPSKASLRFVLVTALQESSPGTSPPGCLSTVAPEERPG